MFYLWGLKTCVKFNLCHCEYIMLLSYFCTSKIISTRLFMKEIIPIIDKFEDKIIEPDKSDIDSIKKFNDLFKDLGL